MIVLRNLARVQLPEANREQVLGMYVHYGSNGDHIRNYKYKAGVAYLPLNADKLKKVAGILDEELVDERSEGAPVTEPFHLNPSFQFRSHQEEPVRRLLEHIHTAHYGVLKADCGCGKTVAMTWVAGHLNSRILVVVDMTVLQTQWQEAFQLVWNKTSQVLKSGDTKFADVCIVTFQLLHSSPELLDRISKHFGCVLLDEFHTTAAVTRKEVLFKLDSKYRIGCTATLMRKNFSADVLTDTVSSVSVEMVDEQALTAQVRFVPTGSVFPYSDPNKWGKIQSAMAKDMKRNVEIAKVIAVNCKLGRKVLCVGITVDSLKAIAKMLEKIPECRVEVYTGSTSLKQDQALRSKLESGTINCILTAKKADKGLDLPQLDTLVLARPANNEAFVQQVSGRIVRRVEGKPVPLIYDMQDGGPLASAFARNRRKWYDKWNYEILS